MISKVGICNKALSHIGCKPIDKLEENTPQAERLSQVFDICLEETLRSAPWSCAHVCDRLVRVSDVTWPGWSYVYGHPNKCLYVRKVFIDDGTVNPKNQPHEIVFFPSISRKCILCNLADVYVSYTYQLEDVTKFDASLVDALSHRLAAEVAVALTGNENLAKDETNLYLLKVADAKRADHSEKNPDTSTNSSTYEDARG